MQILAAMLAAVVLAYGKAASSPRHRLCLGQSTPAAAEDSVESFLADHPQFLKMFAAIATPSSTASMSGLFASTKPLQAPVKEPAVKKDGKKLLARAVDFLQKRMETMPIADAAEDDEHESAGFVEEGRRLMACTRMRACKPGKELETIFYEIYALNKNNEPNTGTLLALPGVKELDGPDGDVQDFVETCIQRPLEWLGQSDKIQVEGFSASSGAPYSILRIIHNLTDQPVETEMSDDTKRLLDEL
mmetsp:Transcript_52142/g.91633  ORF Transcript_52142/g.91633 Transcript_52142/m.91633 type:complete len:246 (+) Transcript_52142:92-829(+)